MKTKQKLSKRLMSFTLALSMVLGLFAGVIPNDIAYGLTTEPPEKINVIGSERDSKFNNYKSPNFAHECFGGLFIVKDKDNNSKNFEAYCLNYHSPLIFDNSIWQNRGLTVQKKSTTPIVITDVAKAAVLMYEKYKFDINNFTYDEPWEADENGIHTNTKGAIAGAQNAAMYCENKTYNTKTLYEQWKNSWKADFHKNEKASIAQAAVWLNDLNKLTGTTDKMIDTLLVDANVIINSARNKGQQIPTYYNVNNLRGIIKDIIDQGLLKYVEFYNYEPVTDLVDLNNYENPNPTQPYNGEKPQPAHIQKTMVATYKPTYEVVGFELSLTIKKIDQSGKSLNGAKFSISGKVKNKLTGLFTDDWKGNGEYVVNGSKTFTSNDPDPITKLEEGTYTIKEVAPPPGGYIMDTRPQTVTISKDQNANKPVVLTFKNEKPTGETPEVGIRKVDIKTGEGLAGAVIEIWSINLDPEIREITETVIDQETGKETEIIVRYEEIEREPFKPTRFTTEADGTISMEKLKAAGFKYYGTYGAREITPPQNYLSTEEMQNFEEFKNITNRFEFDYKEGKENIDLLFQNAEESTLTIKKVDINGNGIAGAKFKVERLNNGEIVETYNNCVSGGDGTINIGNKEYFKPGLYRFTEIFTPEQYIPLKEPYFVQVRYGENLIESIENDRKPSITIKKVSQDGNNLGGAHFKLEYFGEEKNGNPEIIFEDKVTNGNGEILTEKLMPGWYKITEIQAPNGYQILEPDYREVYIRPNENATFTFENFNKPGVLIKKVDQYGKPVDGALFRMEYFGKDGNSGVVQTWDNLKAVDGVFFMGELPIGVYVITETKAPNGYALASPNSAKVTISDGNKEKVYVVTFVNDKTPELKITKIDANDSTKRLKDATFKFEYLGNDTNPNPIGELSYTETTNENGEIIIPHTGMKFGWWQITEIKAPPNYELDEELPFLFHVNPGMEEVLELKFKNKEKSNLEIFKADEETNQPVPNTTFDIYYRKSDADGWKDFKKNVKTDDTGILKYEHLDSGYYKIVEIKAADGYTLSNPNFQEIYIEAGKGTYEVRFDNQRKPDLTIVKIDPLNEKRIDGVKFEVSFSADGTNYGNPKTYVTNKDGKIIINKLDVGNYKITEIDTPVGYKVIKENSKYITLKPMESEMLIFENMPLSSIRVLKYDEKTGKPLPGATFKLTKADGTFIAEQETQADGIAVFSNLDAGDYEVTETKAPEGYGFSKVVTQKVKINYEDKLDQLIKFVKFGNESNVSLQLIKVCATDNSVVLQGAEFEITYADGKSVGDRFYTTDIDGRILIPDLERGSTIVIKETKAPKGFELDTNTKVVVLNEDINTVKFENKPHGKLIVNKYDSDTTGGKITLEGAEFKLMTAAGCEVGLDGNISNATVTTNGRFVTDSNGTFTVTGLKPGAYKLIETKAPNGYQIDKEEITFVINDKGDTQIIDVFNTKLNNLIIVKVDAETNQPLSGAEFKITTSDGKVVDQAGGKISSNGIYTTDNNGQIVITDLKPDTYVITEIKAPEGYLLNDKPITVKVNENDTQTIRVPNTRIGGLIIEKVDSKTGERLPGAEFEIAKMNGERIGKYTTNKDGTIVVPDIESGWYEIKEITSPYGYLLNEEIEKVRRYSFFFAKIYEYKKIWYQNF